MPRLNWFLGLVPRSILPGVLLLAVVPVSSAAAQVGQIDSPEVFLGYPAGSTFTDPESVVDYVAMLAARSPRAELQVYGETPEGRDLVQLVIASEPNLGRLDQILAANAELADATTSPARAGSIAASNPAIVYFSYGIHGDEASSSEAALWTAWDLAGGDPALASVLDSLVVIIDPVANPDGRARYVQWYRSVVGETPNADPQAREHQPPWPGGRFSHYLFDLNRDWSWGTQPETRARLATWWRWNPQVHVDFHEMSPNSTYFFFPPAPPINPIYPDYVLTWGRRFGAGNARAFDQYGWRYFTGESYDMLYPGYGDSWPSLQGAIGMTYEQAGGGAAGVRYARSDGDTLTLADRASHHRVSGAATLRTAAEGKTGLLLDFASANRSAGIDEPDFLLIPDDGGERLDELVEHLLEQGIEVEVANQGFAARTIPYPGLAARTSFPPGTVRVSPRQARGRLAITLLQPTTQLVGDYSYDISAWSLPYAYGIEAHRGSTPTFAGWTNARPRPLSSDLPPLAGYGYLVEPSDRSIPGVIRILREGARVIALGAPTTFGGRDWPAGTWFLPALGRPDLPGMIAAAGLSGEVLALDSGLSQGGPDIGSESTRAVSLPSVALVAGEGVSPTSYGAIWYHLEQELGLPHSVILTEDLERADLNRYSVLILPDMRAPFSEDLTERLGEWVRLGGRLIGVAGGAEAAAPIAEIEVREPPAAEEGSDAERERLLATREQRERMDWESTVPGAIVEVALDPDHPIAWGAGAAGDPERLFVLHTGNSTFEPRDGAEPVASFAAEPDRISGAISDASLETLANSVWLTDRRVGAGEIILFADDPLFRLFWRATHPLFLNAILYGGD